MLQVPRLYPGRIRDDHVGKSGRSRAESRPSTGCRPRVKGHRFLGRQNDASDGNYKAGFLSYALYAYPCTGLHVAARRGTVQLRAASVAEEKRNGLIVDLQY